MYIDYYKTYLQTIQDSIWSDIWRHFFITKDDGKSMDILKNGSVSCAYFVSNILKQFGMIPTSHANVDSTRETMSRSGWYSIDLCTPYWDIPLWSVIFWKEKLWSTDRDIYDKPISSHKHVWFYVWDKKAISNQSDDFYIDSTKVWTPQIHDWRFNWDREIEYIFTYPWDINWSEFIKSDHIHILKNQQLEIPLIWQTAETLKDPKHELTSSQIAFWLGEDSGLKVGRLCGLSCVLMAINYLTRSRLVYKDVIGYKEKSYTFFNPKTQQQETRPVYNPDIDGRNHGWLIQIAQDHGLRGDVLTIGKEDDVLATIAQAIDQDHVLLCSVTFGFDIEKVEVGGHLVVIRWLDRNGDRYNIIINDPIDPKNWAPISVPFDIFVKCFSGKAIKIYK